MERLCEERFRIYVKKEHGAKVVLDNSIKTQSFKPQGVKRGIDGNVKTTKTVRFVDYEKIVNDMVKQADDSRKLLCPLAEKETIKEIENELIEKLLGVLYYEPQALEVVISLCGKGINNEWRTLLTAYAISKEMAMPVKKVCMLSKKQISESQRYEILELLVASGEPWKPDKWKKEGRQYMCQPKFWRAFTSKGINILEYIPNDIKLSLVSMMDNPQKGPFVRDALCGFIETMPRRVSSHIPIEVFLKSDVLFDKTLEMCTEALFLLPMEEIKRIIRLGETKRLTHAIFGLLVQRNKRVVKSSTISDDEYAGYLRYGQFAEIWSRNPADILMEIIQTCVHHDPANLYIIFNLLVHSKTRVADLYWEKKWRADIYLYALADTLCRPEIGEISSYYEESIDFMSREDMLSLKDRPRVTDVELWSLGTEVLRAWDPSRQLSKVQKGYITRVPGMTGRAAVLCLMVIKFRITPFFLQHKVKTISLDHLNAILEDHIEVALITATAGLTDPLSSVQDNIHPPIHIDRTLQLVRACFPILLHYLKSNLQENTD